MKVWIKSSSHDSRNLVFVSFINVIGTEAITKMWGVHSHEYNHTALLLVASELIPRSIGESKVLGHFWVDSLACWEVYQVPTRIPCVWGGHPWLKNIDPQINCTVAKRRESLLMKMVVEDLRQAFSLVNGGNILGQSLDTLTAGLCEEDRISNYDSPLEHMAH